MHCLTIIGEAANKIPKTIQKQYSKIKWREMTAMRNVLIHYYYGADEQVIWKTVKDDLPKLENDIIKMAQDYSGNN